MTTAAVLTKWKKLERGSASAHFIRHFAALAPTSACQKLLKKLATLVSRFETVVDDEGDPELVVHFSDRANWRCFEPASRASVVGLPPTYAKLMLLHNGLVHHFADYTWDDIWLSSVDPGDGERLASLTVINVREAYFYELVPSKRVSNGEPAIAVKGHEGKRRSARQLLFTEPYGAPGLFLRLAARELLGRDEPLLGGYLGPD